MRKGVYVISFGDNLEFSFESLVVMVAVFTIAVVVFLVIINYKKTERWVRKAYREYTATGSYTCGSGFALNSMMNVTAAFLILGAITILILVIVAYYERIVLNSTVLWIIYGGFIFPTFICIIFLRIGSCEYKVFTLKNNQLIVRYKGWKEIFDIADIKFSYYFLLNPGDGPDGHTVFIHTQENSRKHEYLLRKHSDETTLLVFCVLLSYLQNNRLSELETVTKEDTKKVKSEFYCE